MNRALCCFAAARVVLLVLSVALGATPPAGAQALAFVAIPQRQEMGGEPPQRVVWNRLPIRVTLPVGRERLVTFPASVQVGIPPQVAAGLRTQSVNGTIYWLARKPFGPARVQVVEVDTGHHYLLDLEARADGPTAPMVVMRPDHAPTVATGAGLAGVPPATPTQPTGASARRDDPDSGFDYVTLVRFAARQLYGPDRLAHPLPGLHRRPVGKAAGPDLLRGARVEATPLAAWQGGGYHLTAVLLRNRTAEPVVLDPRDLRGAWQAAAFQHGRLFPAGDSADSSCVYLVSGRPYAEALRGVY